MSKGTDMIYYNPSKFYTIYEDLLEKYSEKRFLYYNDVYRISCIYSVYDENTFTIYIKFLQVSDNINISGVDNITLGFLTESECEKFIIMYGSDTVEDRGMLWQ